MKQGWSVAILLGCMLWQSESFVFADFLVRVDTDRTTADVPMGNVLLREGSLIRFNSSGVIGSTGVSVGANSTIAIEVQARAIFLAVTKGTTVFGNDLVINSTFSPQTEIQSYTRKTSLGGVVTNSPNDTFTATENFDISVNFALSTNSSAQQYQYYFNTTPATIVNGQAELNKGQFYASSPTTAIPWSVISHLGTGNNQYGTIRVIDFALRSYDVGFEFSITPMGGGAAVPEPSSWWTVGIIAAGYASRTGWKRWKRKQLDAATGATKKSSTTVPDADCRATPPSS